MTVTANQIRNYIENYIRPRIQADGGEIEYVSFEGETLTVKAQGECSICPITNTCFKEWVISKLYSEFKHNFKLRQIIDRPYFWDK